MARSPCLFDAREARLPKLPQNLPALGLGVLVPAPPPLEAKGPERKRCWGFVAATDYWIYASVLFVCTGVSGRGER